MTLTEFLLARIAEDEDRAKRAAFGWGAKWSFRGDFLNDWFTIDAEGKRDMVGCEDDAVIALMARHDPARVLAECEAKRAIVALYQREGALNQESRDTDRRWSLEPVVRILALPYADHPDYLPEWKS